MLESLKEKIETKRKNGKITEEKAKELSTKIDKKIEKIKEFNKLPLEQKKSVLISNLESRLNKKLGW